MWVGWAAIGLWLATIAPFGLRVSAGNAASVAKRRFAYFDGWAVSRNRFRTLFGSFLALWLIWVAIWFALFVGGAYLNGLIADDVAQPALYDQLMTFDLLISISVANLVLTFLSAGVNARAVIAAGEEGKITGVSADVASVFD
jgi:hypothetical protein